MDRKRDALQCWPEDPTWPDPSGNDPYDIIPCGLF